MVWEFQKLHRRSSDWHWAHATAIVPSIGPNTKDRHAQMVWLVATRATDIVKDDASVDVRRLRP